MTSPRTPRQWAEGDTIPADVTAVHHHHEPLLDECGTQCAWIRRASDWKGQWGYALEEEAMLRRMGPVTEVIEDVPLSEVLPETPEPPQVQGHRNGCPGCKHERGAYPPCWTVEQMDEEATRLLQLIAASQSVPAVPVSSTGGKETGEAAETATEALRAELTDAMDAQLRAALAPPDALVFSPILAQAAIEYFVRVGWSPSLPDSETEWQLELEDGYVEQLADEKTAREYVRNGFRVTSRPVGPWTAVQT